MLLAFHMKMIPHNQVENRMVNLKKKINFFAKNYGFQNNKVSIFMNLSCVQESHFHKKK